MTLKTQVARGLKWQAFKIFGRQLLSFLVFTTLARLLEPAIFGLVGLVGIYLGFVGMFVDQGIGTALIQRQHLKQEHLDAAFWFNVSCAGILCLGTIALANPVSLLLGEPRLAPLLRWASLALIINATSAVHAALFTRDMDFRQPAIRALVANLVGGVIGVSMALTGFGVWALIGQQLALSITSSGFLWAVSTYRPSFRFSLTHLRELLGVGTSVFATSLLWFLSSRLDQMIIGRSAGVPTLGLYVIAGKIPELAKVLTHQPIAEVSLPALARLQDDHGKLRQAIYDGMELNSLISFAVFVGLAAVATDLVPLLFGSKWISAAGICSLLSLYALVNALQVFFHPSLLASGGIGRYVLLNVLHTAGVIVACAVGIQFGVNYVVIGLILNGLFVAWPALMYLRRRIGLSPLAYCRPCLAPAFASFFMVSVIWLMGNYLLPETSRGLRLSAEIVVGASVYIGSMLVLKRTAVINLIESVRHVFKNRSIPVS